MQPILNVILASRKPLTISEIYEAVWTSNINLTRQDFSKRLHLLRRVVRLNSDGTVLLFHHSFAEWLLDVKHCTRKFLCSAEQGHGMLAMSHSLRAKELNSEDIQNFALHLTRMPPPDEAVVNFIDKNLNFDYNTILVLWLIQSGANVENCLLGEEKKDEIIEYVVENENYLKKAASVEPNRKRTNSLNVKDQRGKLPKYENYDVRKKFRSKKHSALKKNQISIVTQSCQYEKLKESYEELEFEPYGRRDLEKEKRISEDYDHLEFDLKKPEKKTIITETNELLEQLTNLDLGIKKDETGFFETEKSPDFLKDFNEHNFKFSTIDSTTKNNDANFLKLDSEDSGFLKSEDASTLGLRSDGHMTLSSTNEEGVNETTLKSDLTREEELDLLLNGLEKSLNEESKLLDDGFLSQITQNSIIGLKKEEAESEKLNETFENAFSNNDDVPDIKVDKDCVVLDKLNEIDNEVEKEASQEVEEENKEVVLSSLLEILQYPKDPKVLKILTEAGAKVSNCNSLQRDGKCSSLDGGIDGVISSQVNNSLNFCFRAIHGSEEAL